MAGKKAIAAIHGGAADRVLDEVRVDVDPAIFQKQPEAIVAFQHIGHGLAEVGFARDPRGLRRQPREELVNQWRERWLRKSEQPPDWIVHAELLGKLFASRLQTH